MSQRALLENKKNAHFLDWEIEARQKTVMLQ